VALSLFLQAVIADGIGGAQSFLDVSRLQEMAGVVRPNTGVEIGLKFEAHRKLVEVTLTEAGPLGIDHVGRAEELLHVVADFMGDDVSLGEVTGGTELVCQLREKADVEIDAAVVVGRAIEWSGGGTGAPAAGADHAAEKHEFGIFVLLPSLTRQDIPPHVLSAGEHDFDEFHRGFLLRCGGLVFLRAARRSAATHVAKELTGVAAHQHYDNGDDNGTDAAARGERAFAHAAAIFDVTALALVMGSHGGPFYRESRRAQERESPGPRNQNGELSRAQWQSMIAVLPLPMSSLNESPAPSAASAPLVRPPSLAGFWAGAAAGVSVATLAWVPGAGEATGIFHATTARVDAPVTFGISALAGITAAWVGWAVDSWARRGGILLAVLVLAGTQAALMAQKFGMAWEPFSFAAAVAAGLIVAGLQAPRGAGVERFFQGRLAPAPFHRLAVAQSADFLLPDQREAAVLTCRMLNEAALREQRPAREFLKLMEAFRQTASRVLLERGALLDAPESGTVRAFFGLPLAVENHADQAAAAALELADALKQFDLAQMHREYRHVECGIGVTCGTLTAGVTGETYSAAGDAVEQSRWLAGLNADYGTTILSDKATHLMATNTEDRPLEILNPPEGAALEIMHLLATRGGLSGEALARRDAFRDAIMLLRAGHAEDALRRFEDARHGLVIEDSALDRFVAQAEHQIERDGRKPPPPSRPRARFSLRRIARL